MLEKIKKQLEHYTLESVSASAQNDVPLAAVMLLLHGDPEDPQIILTQRAKHLTSHAGEVAFPGGMKENIDNDLLATALRETQEEISLSSGNIKVLGKLPSDSPRLSMIRVTPFMGWVDSLHSLSPDPSEIASVFNFPLSFLLDINHYQYFEFEEGKIRLPYVEYQDYKIWGFTLKVMVDMLNHTLDAQIKLCLPTKSELKQLGYQ